LASKSDADGGGDGAMTAVDAGRAYEQTTDPAEAPDASNPAASTETQGSEQNAGGSRKHHINCELPLDEPLPELPEVPMTADGRPLFDTWRDMDCEEAEAQTSLCSGAGTQPGACILGDSGGQGVATFGDVDTRCDGEGPVIGHHHGQCWVCSPVEVHARACCEMLAGFDCRAWPYPADGKPGMVCARHGDCEPGLLCGAGGDYAGGYGICQCPGLSGPVQQPESCWDDFF